MGKKNSDVLSDDDREDVMGRLKTKTGRREFIRGLGYGAGAATLGAAGLSAAIPAKAQTQANLDVDILTFALNLEYLEAEYYHIAVLGTKLFANEIGPNPGPTTGGYQVPFQIPQVQAFALEIQREEQNHVRFLQAALTAATGSYISKPTLDFQNSFPTLAAAAGLGSGFDAFANDFNFLLAAYVFEDVGVTAYHGAAPLITDKTYLDKAAGILAVEAYHAGAVRAYLFNAGMDVATTLISKLRATLDGTIGTQNVDDAGVGNTSYARLAVDSNSANGSTLLGGFPSNSPPGNNSIAFDRTTQQVLNIVYGAQNVHSGLFFPQGLNGAIS